MVTELFNINLDSEVRQKNKVLCQSDCSALSTERERSVHNPSYIPDADKTIIGIGTDLSSRAQNCQMGTELFYISI